jgi:hypothetical protein
MLAAVGAMSFATAPASAGIKIHQVFTNWVVSGSLTPKKLNEPVVLPKGSTFNGEANVEIPGFHGTITGTVFVPPWNATVKLLGLVPSTVGLTFKQIGNAEGTVVPDPEAAVDCPNANPEEGGSLCVTVSVPTKANLGITVVGLLGINVPTQCETAEPITLPLSTHLTVRELFVSGPRFKGTATIPPIKCEGLSGIALGLLLTTLISGPENPYAIGIAPPA